MNQLQIFNFEEKQVRIVDQNNQEWFVARDICDILGLDNLSMAMQRVYDKNKLTSKILMSGQMRDVFIISEAGLYQLIFTSNKPNAQRFTDWVTSEVLPSIRKTGQYSIKTDPLPSEIDARKAKAINDYVEITAKGFKLEEKPKMLFLMNEYQKNALPLPHIPQLVCEKTDCIHERTAIYKMFGTSPRAELGKKIKNLLDQYQTDTGYAKMVKQRSFNRAQLLLVSFVWFPEEDILARAEDIRNAWHNFSVLRYKDYFTFKNQNKARISGYFNEWNTVLTEVMK